MNNKDCIFCKIVRGEIPSYKVYEDDETYAFLDINPTAPGHTLVIPKQHAMNIFEVSANDWGAVTETVRRLAGVLEQSLDADGINVMMNNREVAGQLVDHAHVHLIPRFKGDGLRPWPHGSYKDGEARQIQEKIRSELQ